LRSKALEDDARAVPVWPDMKAAFVLFCDAPWDSLSLGMGGSIRTNINRVQLEASARLLDVKMTPDVFADIRILENETIRYWSSKR